MERCCHHKRVFAVRRPRPRGKGGPPICCITVPGCGREIKLTGGVKFVTAEPAQRRPKSPDFPGFSGIFGLAQRSQQTRLAACLGRGVERLDQRRGGVRGRLGGHSVSLAVRVASLGSAGNAGRSEETR